MAEIRYNSLDNQSPTQTQLQNEDLKIPRSAFDFSTIHSGNAFIGGLIPVDCFDVVPGENISISMANLLEFRNPTTRQLLNGFRVYFHGYYNRLTDLWEGAKNFLDTGLSGTISLSRPALVYDISLTQLGEEVYANACTPMSLLNFLGLPAEYYCSKTNGGSIDLPLLQFKSACNPVNENGSHQKYIVQLSANVDYFPADCAFAYQRNWRDYYSNRNLLQANKYWFPDNESHFILSYSCESAVCINYENEILDDNSEYIFQNLTGFASLEDTEGMTSEEREEYFWTSTREPNNPCTVSPSGSFTPVYAPNLSGLKFRQFRGDRFTTALPFPDLIRGDIPVIDLNQSNYVYMNQVDSSGNVINVIPVNGENADSYGSINAGLNRSPYNTVGVSIVDDSNHQFNLSVMPVSSITQNALRALETFTVFKERNARISSRDSFYNGFIEAQFGSNPHTHDARGIYLGGFYQDFAMSSVTQTSQSDDSPLGTKAGQGVSNGNGTICNDYYCPDFGWIQIYMSIVPDVFYTQGKPRMYSKKTQLDMYFPLFNNLEPQAILNKELFVSGDSSVDDDVFGYEDRYAEYKSRPNRVSGFMGLSHSVAEFDSSRIMARRFTSTPALNHQFVTMVPENIDMEVFSVYDEPPFDFQCGISVRRVAPMPYTAVPGSMSSQIHA